MKGNEYDTSNGDVKIIRMCMSTYMCLKIYHSFHPHLAKCTSICDCGCGSNYSAEMALMDVLAFLDHKMQHIRHT